LWDWACWVSGVHEAFLQHVGWPLLHGYGDHGSWAVGSSDQHVATAC
jgi:hypothetical protein